MLLVTYLTNTKICKKLEKWLEPWNMGTHMRVLSESYPMNTNMTGLDGFLKSLYLWFWVKVDLALEGLVQELNVSSAGLLHQQQKPLLPISDPPSQVNEGEISIWKNPYLLKELISFIITKCKNLKKFSKNVLFWILVIIFTIFIQTSAPPRRDKPTDIVFWPSEPPPIP